MAGAKKSLFLFKDVSRIRVAADEGVERMVELPSRLRSWHIRIVRSLSRVFKTASGMPLKKTTEKALAKCQCACLLVFFQQAAFGRRRIRDSCHFTILRSKYAQMQVDISTICVWPQIAVLIIGNRLYHASRNKLIPLH
jgi:hypothetical protein